MANLRYVGPSRKDLTKLGIKPGSMVHVPDWMVYDNVVLIHTLFDPIVVPLSHFCHDDAEVVDLVAYMESLTRQFE